MNTRRLIFITKLLVSGLLLALLLLIIDWRESISLLVRIRLLYFVLLITIGLVMIAASALKWQLFLHARGLNVPIGRLILLYIVGYTFNNFLPSNIGGDVVRGVALGYQTGNMGDSFGSVFLERFTGVFGLVVLALVAFGLNLRMAEMPMLRLFLLVWLAALTGVLVLFFTNAARRLVELSTRWAGCAKPHAEILRFLAALYSLRRQPAILVKALLLSLFFHAMTTINTYVACLALSLEVNVLDIAVIVPIILMVSMIPLSVSSVGVWEGAFVYFFSLVGISGSAALSLALLLRAKGIVFALMGGGILLVWKGIYETPAARKSRSIIAGKGAV